MELQYIWIQDFRNIHDCGFNFGSNSIYNYSKESNALKSKSIENVIPNFFHSNITNISGIVGRNGTGKSNVLELINYVFRSPKSSNLSPFFLIIKDDDRLKCFCYHMPAPSLGAPNLEIDFFDYEELPTIYTHIYFSNVFDNRKSLFSDEIIDLSTNKFGWNKYGENIHSYQQEEIRNQIRFINSKYFRKVKNEDLRIPKEIILSSPLWINLKNKANRVESKFGITGLLLHLKYH